ncbi:MAG: hypothetical protein JXB39_10375 [Deltaproteobacteria bacterium]|nr:hypothetical protein [Deltaproteobacteria bacterium]
MTSFVIVAVAALAVGYMVASRLASSRSTPFLAWILLVAAVAAPVWIARVALFPPPAVQTLDLPGKGARGTFDVPPGTDLLVTATLSVVEDIDKITIDDKYTRYELLLRNDDKREILKGMVLRESEDDAVPISDAEDGIRSRDRRFAARWSEETQTRFPLQRIGSTEVVATEWKGRAAETLRLDLVHAPPRPPLLWAGALALGILAILCDVRWRTDKIASEFGFLLGACHTIARDLTPAGNLKETLFSVSMGALVGGLVLGIAGWIARKAFGVKDPPKPGKVKKTVEP